MRVVVAQDMGALQSVGQHQFLIIQHIPDRSIRDNPAGIPDDHA